MKTLTRRSFTTVATAGAAAISAKPLWAQTPQAAEDETRIVTDVYGEIEVPVNPQRIVVLDSPQLDACLAVGVKPVGAVTAFDGAEFPAYLGDATEGIEHIGTIAEPNLEKIIDLNPDLILGSNMRNQEIHANLVEIAPTIFSEEVSDDWRGNFQLFTDALNKSAEATEVLDTFDARLQDFQEKTEGEREGWLISVARFRPEEVRLYMEPSFVGTILSAAGLKRPESQTGPGPERDIFTVISPEQIQLADGTHIFTCAYGDIADTSAAEIVNSPLWGTLEAVRNDKVYWVEDEFWMVAVGILAANKIVDDLFTYLVDGEPGVAIPV